MENSDILLHLTHEEALLLQSSVNCIFWATNGVKGKIASLIYTRLELLTKSKAFGGELILSNGEMLVWKS